LKVFQFNSVIIIFSLIICINLIYIVNLNADYLIIIQIFIKLLLYFQVLILF